MTARANKMESTGRVCMFCEAFLLIEGLNERGEEEYNLAELSAKRGVASKGCL